MDWDDFGSEKCTMTCMDQEAGNSIWQSRKLMSLIVTSTAIVLSIAWWYSSGPRRKVVSDPNAAQQVLNESSSNMAHRGIHSEWVSRVFGCDLSAIDSKAFLRDWNNSVILSLIMEPGSTNMVKSQDKILQRKIVNLVTFAPSMVDQEQWERSGNTEVVETDNGEQAALVDLG